MSGRPGEPQPINMHIPQFIAKAPWYMTGEDNSNLQHQRAAAKEFDKSWYQRGARTQAATKWRKGSCENCGAMSHKTKDCCERPRKVGARWNGKDIRPDEAVQDLTLDYDGKRDRWNGYDATGHMDMMEDFEKVETERRKKRKEEELNKFMTEVDEDYARYPIGKEKETKKFETLVESDSDEDSDKDEEQKDFIASDASIEMKKDPKTRTTIRNLRIREDTASYLKDITGNQTTSYDPKSRRTKDVSGLVDENEFSRAANDQTKFTEVQRYAWDAYEKGQDIHLTGAPSQAELAYREYKGKKDVLTKEQKDAILARYGGQEHLETPRELLVSQSENFVTYNPDGSVSRGQEKAPAIPKSRYEEDVYLNNHTSVWGSYWDNGQWGYACCHQFVKKFILYRKDRN